MGNLQSSGKFKVGDKVRVKETAIGYDEDSRNCQLVFGKSYDDWNYTMDKYPDDFELVEVEQDSNNKKHIHYDMIVQWVANPSRVVQYDVFNTVSGEEDWYDCPANSPTWNPLKRYRFKPEEPERVFPTTNMTDDDLIEVYCQADALCSADQYRAIANEAVKRYILEQENTTEQEE